METVTPTSLDRATLLALVNASRVILSHMDMHDRFQRIAEQAAQVLDAQGASVLILDSSREQLIFEAAMGPGSEHLRGERFKADLGIAGQAIRAGRVINVDDVTQNNRFFAGIDEKTKTKTRAILAAPLIHDELVIGVLEVINPKDRPRFNARDMALLEVFANLVAVAARDAQTLDRVSRENIGLRQALPTPEVVGLSPALTRAITLCKKVAPTPTTVLLYGETGTGKELAARSIHDFSPRASKPFIAINCAALSETLLESELFGHEKGSFTGATNQKAGRFELADGGTLFLDEIGEIPATTQVKLLRVLQERQFTRVGGTITLSCDVRLIAATNRDLKSEMDAGRFRSDLYFRLNVFPITLPPLRERSEDLAPLVEHFTRQLAPSLGVAPPQVSPEAMAALRSYHWPGNIRELRNIIERCALLADGPMITVADLPPEIARAAGDGAGHLIASSSNAGKTPVANIKSVSSSPAADAPALTSRLADQERQAVQAALEKHGWNQSAAARELGLSRDNLRYRMSKYQLQKPASNKKAEVSPETKSSV